MQRDNTIALDLMGGDLGTQELVLGASRFIENNPNVNFMLYGDEKVCLPILNSHRNLQEKSIFNHCDISIAMDERPADALRRGRNVSSMWRAIEAVKKNKAASIVTAGNTGALIAMSRLCLSKISGIDRPSLAAFWPTIRGKCVILDVGASIGAVTVDHMIQLSILGGMFARSVLGIKRPSIGLLNVGIEEIKGHDVLKETSRLLRDDKFDSFEYKGFIEANDISNGLVDVVVTDGFSGNIAIKAAEGAAKRVVEVFKEALNRNLWSRIGCFFINGALRDVKEGFDPRNFNGGVLLGVDGLVVKGHGSSDAKSIFNVLDIAINMSKNDFISMVKVDIQKFKDNSPDISDKDIISDNGNR
ncbi:phosphate acyltransferase PlsX [Candidatus Liberibacter americanus]|uniref:Phosphate acyltransferase n=1 Tax=Candidatus Liberibacter americanus str. Sao Paulo TaxID=1261131 RepID=U6B7S7_9HYPH|nr:phosphate acyltransferase PlsX [Candidatus Liberibacter americanus]AHA27777.1 Fatty acid/phospholipid biosynthesis enzyme [Candidatus Liberibacter americanus str. Sao Paulo]EMS36162.1 putative glycerol-3-phosphate acyltransferase PlsX [Candidatus Liberibacter americanus PW_SP]